MKIRIFLFSFVFVELGHRRFAFAGVLYPKDNISKSSEFDDLQSSENESGSKGEISENVKDSGTTIKTVPDQYEDDVGDLHCAYCYQIPNEEARLYCIKKYCEADG
ncbi:uncharacterized protein LOC125681546 [Ostrea edulis]|uniref:uncharacterized protein LOC125681546 n=1 Tax=Ostrea edulis TaxID=37623 RepID=UPI0024AF9411|nr:uncharacterized protein LOC125681546 [Ostrea edulis]